MLRAMRRRVMAVLLLAAGSASAQEGVPEPAPREAPRGAERAAPLVVGAKLPESVVVTPLASPSPAAGEAEADPPSEPAPPSPVALASLAGQPARPLVVLFWSARCPVCRRYNTLFRGLVKEYGDRVAFAVVCPNANETDEYLRGTLRDARIEAPAASDRQGRASEALGVRVTPTALLFDPSGTLRYRGPLDDDRKHRERDTTEHLRLALDAVLGGRDVPSADPRAFGSAVRR